MSKKRFTEGMESLFEEPTLKGSDQESISSQSESAQSQTERKKKKKSGGKNFTSDLSSFLQSSFEESFEQKLEERRQGTPQNVKKRSPRPLSGLDALIRSTIEPSKIKLDQNQIRRLTLAFDEQKLQKLKTIARIERTYLKDIIDDIVEEFIREYEASKGKID